MPYLRDLKAHPPKGLSNAPGVYKITILDENGSPKPVCRIGGMDKRGVMYIGRSQHLRARLRTLCRMFYEGSPRGHIAALTYWACPRLESVAPSKNLGFWYKHCTDCSSEEEILLKRYFRRFGEVPPLNGRAEFIVPEVRAQLSELGQIGPATRI